MKTRAELLRWSKETDFRPEALEKVYLLQAILHRLEDNELSQGQWVLKGGTAINLFHWAVPRLSVDIDINFIGVEDVGRLPSSRDVFESSHGYLRARRLLGETSPG
jgi:predicted nucleotidyltransferase component of viral defense system